MCQTYECAQTCKKHNKICDKQIKTYIFIYNKIQIYS